MLPTLGTLSFTFWTDSVLFWRVFWRLLFYSQTFGVVVFLTNQFYSVCFPFFRIHIRILFREWYVFSFFFSLTAVIYLNFVVQLFPGKAEFRWCGYILVMYWGAFYSIFSAPSSFWHEQSPPSSPSCTIFSTSCFQLLVYLDSSVSLLAFRILAHNEVLNRHQWRSGRRVLSTCGRQRCPCNPSPPTHSVPPHLAWQK